MTTGDPKRIGTLLRKVYDLIGDGVLPVPEHTTYPLTEAATAIRAISAAEHTGKLVLSVPRSGPTRVAVPPTLAPVFRSDGAYLVTGGVGGLGLFLAAVMASGGCGRIVLTSRSQPNAQAQKMIARLRGNGADVVVECGNIADPDTATDSSASPPPPDCRCAASCTPRGSSTTRPLPTSPMSSSNEIGHQRSTAHGICTRRSPTSRWTGSATSPRPRCCLARRDRARMRRPTAGWTPSRHGNAARVFRRARLPGARGPTSVVAPQWQIAAT